MINFTNVLIAMNVKGNAVATGLNVDVCFAGRTLNGKIYEPDPAKNYIRFDLIPNEVERRSLADGEAEVMQSGIYQVTVYVGKSGDSNPDIESMKITDTVRGDFAQGLKLSKDNQTCKIVNASQPVKIPNETHHTAVVSVYFDCIA